MIYAEFRKPETCVSNEVLIAYASYNLYIGRQYLCFGCFIFLSNAHSFCSLGAFTANIVSKSISQKRSWDSVCFPSCTANLQFDLGRSLLQHKWKIRFVFPFLLPCFSFNGSLKESLKGDSGKHFSSPRLILCIWTASAISFFLLDNSSEKLKNYLFMMISFLSAFLKMSSMFEEPQQAFASKICSKENNNKAKTMTNSISTEEDRRVV